MIVMEALGKALVLEPYLATVVIGGGFLRHGGSAEQKAAHIPGSSTAARPLPSRSSRRTRATISPTFDDREEEGRRLGHQRREVRRARRRERRHLHRHRPHQGWPARRGRHRRVPGARQRQGRPAKGYPTQDGLHAADVTFDRVEVGADAVLGDAENGLPLVERVVDEARIALCAEAVGAMDESLKSRSNI